MHRKVPDADRRTTEIGARPRGRAPMLPGPSRPVRQVRTRRPSDRPDDGWLPAVGPLSTGRAYPPARTPDRNRRAWRLGRRPAPAARHPLDLAAATRRRTPSLGQRAMGRSERQPLPVVGLNDGTCRTPVACQPVAGRSISRRGVSRRRVSDAVRSPAGQVPDAAAASGRLRMVRGEQPAGGQHVVGVDHRRAATAAPPTRRRGRPAPRRGPPARPPAGACRSTPPEPDDQPHVAQVPPPAAAPRACRRSATVAASAARRASSAGRRRRRAGRRVGRPRAAAAASASGSAPARSSRSARGGRDDPRRAPPHAEVALDGAGRATACRRPRGAARPARRPGSAPSTRRWWPRRRRPPAGRRRPRRRAAPPRSAPRPGWPPRTSEANRGPRDSRLPPMTWRRNTSRIAARAGAGVEHADARQHVAGRGRPARRAPASSPVSRVAHVGVAGQHHRHPPAGPRPAGWRCAAARRRRRRRCRRPAAPRRAGPRAARASAGARRAGRRPRARPGRRPTAPTRCPASAVTSGS